MAPASPQEKARAQTPKRNGNKRAMQQAGHQPLSHVAAKKVERKRRESRDAPHERGHQPHLADGESETDGERVTDEVRRANVAADGRNKERNELGRLFGKRCVKRSHPLIGCRRGAQVGRDPMVQRNANEIKGERLHRQGQRRCQPHEPLLGRHFQPMDDRDKDRGGDPGRNDFGEINALHFQIPRTAMIASPVTCS